MSLAYLAYILVITAESLLRGANNSALLLNTLAKLLIISSLVSELQD